MDLGDNVKRIDITSYSLAIGNHLDEFKNDFFQKFVFSKNSIEFENYFLK